MSIVSIGYVQKQAQSHLCAVATYGTRFGEGRIATKRRAPFHLENRLDPETALWRAVVLRAMRDAAGDIETSNLKRESRLVAVRIAQGWFRRADEGFQAICDAASLNAQCVRRAAMAQFIKLPKAPKQKPRKMMLVPGKAA